MVKVQIYPFPLFDLLYLPLFISGDGLPKCCDLWDIAVELLVDHTVVEDEYKNKPFDNL